MHTSENKKKDKRKILFSVYLTTVFLLLVVSLCLIIPDLFGVLDLEKSPFHEIDLAIMGIFWMEYIVRFLCVKQKGKFFRENFIELVSILPFSNKFGILHLFRLLRFIRLIKLFRLSDSLRKRPAVRLVRKAKKSVALFINSCGFVYGLYASVLLLFTVSFGVELVESVSYGTALGETLIGTATIGLAGAPSIVGKICEGILLAVCFGLAAWLIAAAAAYSRRFARLRSGTKHLFSPKSEPAVNGSESPSDFFDGNSERH